MSGEAGLPPDALRRLARPLAPLFGMGVALRNRLYDAGVLRVHRVDVPVIAVGNLTVGGTGKTPLTRAIAQDLLTRGESPAILLRGYGARGATCPVPGWTREPPPGALDTFGDEALGHARAVPGATVYAHPDRVASAHRAVRAGATVLVCDDAFQHRRLARDANLLCLDWTSPLGDGRLLPAGLLREPVSSASRATLLCWTRYRSDEVGDEAARIRIRRIAHGVPEVRWRFLPGALRWAGDQRSASLRRVVVAAGIGRPASFADTCREAGLKVVRVCAFPDHHRFRPHDLERLEAMRVSERAEAVVITEKDEVRIPTGTPKGRMAVLELACRPEDALPDLISPARRPGES
jgi:tetraacyldisaccharide 4'-kinase